MNNNHHIYPFKLFSCSLMILLIAVISFIVFSGVIPVMWFSGGIIIMLTLICAYTLEEAVALKHINDDIKKPGFIITYKPGVYESKKADITYKPETNLYDDYLDLRKMTPVQLNMTYYNNNGLSIENPLCFWDKSDKHFIISYEPPVLCLVMDDDLNLIPMKAWMKISVQLDENKDIPTLRKEVIQKLTKNIDSASYSELARLIYSRYTIEELCEELSWQYYYYYMNKENTMRNVCLMTGITASDFNKPILVSPNRIAGRLYLAQNSV